MEIPWLTENNWFDNFGFHTGIYWGFHLKPGSVWLGVFAWYCKMWLIILKLNIISATCVIKCKSQPVEGIRAAWGGEWSFCIIEICCHKRCLLVQGLHFRTACNEFYHKNYYIYINMSHQRPLIFNWLLTKCVTNGGHSDIPYI